MPARYGIAALVLALVALGLAGPWGGDVLPGDGSGGRTSPAASSAAGRRLFVRFDCVRCHSAVRGGRGIDIPPSLDAAGDRAPAEWMARYILDPTPLRYRSEGTRSDLRMPRIAMRPDEASRLADFLAARRRSGTAPDSASSAPLDSTLAARGAVLFDQYQCRGCHQLDGRGGRVGPSLDGVGDRRRPAYVRSLLLDPGRVVPGTAMKKLDLWEDEADAITAFLMTRRSPSGPGGGK